MAAKLCTVCKIRRPKTGSKGGETSPHNDMCNYCFEEGSWENSHQDEGHDLPGMNSDSTATDECWICHPELNLAQKATKGSTGPKVQGTRRPQLNHKGHNHPQTPAARRACKAAFWAQSTVEAGAWDYRCDGNGKAAVWAGVQPKAKNNKVDMQAVGEQVKRTLRLRRATSSK